MEEIFLITWLGLYGASPQVGLEVEHRLTDSLGEGITATYIHNEYNQLNIGYTLNRNITDDIGIGTELGIYNKFTTDAIDHHHLYYKMNIAYLYNRYSFSVGACNECYTAYITPRWENIRFEAKVTYKF